MADPVTAAVAIGWGMKAAGWVASPIISELYKKGSSYLGFDASKKLKELEPNVSKLEWVMEAVEESPFRPRLEQQYRKLKSAFYEAEDILDEVEYYRLKSEVTGPPCKKDRMKKIWSAIKKSSPLKDQESGMSKIKLKQSLDKIEKVINDACKILELMNLPEISNANRRHVAAKSRGAVTTATPPPVVIGRDEDCDKIVAMLHEKEEDGQPDTSSAQCYSVIGIHGIGGSGKSTLAQLVCAREKKDRQEKKDGHFDLVMWVHVSQDFSVATIFKEMFEAATGKECPQFNNLDTLQDNVGKELHGKRFLLVLDDVWYDIRDVSQYEKLQQILSPLNAAEAGSKILVTSRTEDALLAMGAAKQRCIPMSILGEDVFLNLFMHYALHGAPIHDGVRRRLEDIGTDIAKKLKGSPLAAKIVGGQLRIRQNIEFWRIVRDRDLLNETMGALWWSYQHLNEQVRRCFAYCSIFPRRRRLARDELVKLWAAEGFVRCTNEGEETEDVCQEYFDELVSTSFLQLGVKEKPHHEDYYLVHDLLHDLAEKVAGSDCFRIENHGKWTMEGCAEGVAPDVRHVFLQRYDAALITEKICKLDNLRTLIIDGVVCTARVEKKVLNSMFSMLRKLRVLIITTGGLHDFMLERENIFSVPASIGQLRHLRYLAFRNSIGGPIFIKLVLPGTFTKLYHMQFVDFGCIPNLVFTSWEDMCSLINLRHFIYDRYQKFPSLGKLTSLRTLEYFTVREEQGYELKQLGNLSKLGGTLAISDLGNVERMEEALEAKLADKEGLRELELSWDWNHIGNPQVEEEVLEGLCPPKYLESLNIECYRGLRYPSWMVGKHNGGPKYLNHLRLFRCTPELGPELRGFCTHLCCLSISACTWDALPDCIEHLTSLQRLEIDHCWNIRSLPTLPLSLQHFSLRGCNEMLMSSCKKTGDHNWQKIQHVLSAEIGVYHDGELKMGAVKRN